MKKIKDISVEEIYKGSNWKVNPKNDFNQAIEEWEVKPNERFNSEDIVAYSGISVTEDENVSPLILIKEVGQIDYGGDYCEYKDGKWKQVGLEPNLTAAKMEEFIANPLNNDPSFDSINSDFRDHHRKSFSKWKEKINI